MNSSAVAPDRHVQDLAPVGDFGDDRFLGQFRKSFNGVHPGLDVVQHLPRVRPQFKLHQDGAEPLGGGGGDFLDAVQPLDRLLDLDGDPFLHLFRRGAQIGDPDADQIQAEFREHFLLHADEGEAACEHDQGHEQVGRHPVTREPFDGPVHDPVSWIPVDPYFHTVGHRLQRRDADPFTRFQAGTDHDVIPGCPEDVQGPEPHPVVVTYHQDLVFPAQRFPGHQEHVLHFAPVDFRLHEHPGSQRGTVPVFSGAVRVGHPGDGADHPAAGVDLTFGPDQGSFPGMPHSCELGVQGDPGGPACCSFPAVGQRNIEIRQVGVGKRQSDLGVVHRVQCRHRRAPVDELADISVLHPNPPCVRSAELGPLQVPARLLQGGFGGGQAGPGVLELGLPQGQGGWLFIAAQFHPLLAGDLRLRFFTGQGQGGPGHVSFGPHHPLAVVVWIDAEQHIALLEKAAGNKSWRNGYDPARHFGNQLALGSGTYRSLAL